MDDHALPKKISEGGIDSPITLSESISKQSTATGIDGPLIAKIPVVLAEPEIQVNISSIIQLEEAVLEIQRIKKNVYLTQCKLVRMETLKSGKLFISGFVRKNIEYATVEKEYPEKGIISGDIRYTTVKIPFQCETTISFVNVPILCEEQATTKVEISANQIINCNTCSQNMVGQTFCDKKIKDYEEYGEKIFCELEEVRIFEDNQQLNPVSLGCCFPYEQVFQKIEEKMVLYLKIKVLQNQPVNIPENFSDNNQKSNVSSYDLNDEYIQNEGWRIVPRSSLRLRNKKNKSQTANNSKTKKHYR